MNKVIEEIRPCKHCGIETSQKKNSERLNWVLHIVLTIFTLGTYTPIFAIIAMAHWLGMANASMVNVWICDQCNNKPLFGGQ